MKKFYLPLLLLILSQLMIAQTPTFWGMTKHGGTDGGGVIFRTDSMGNNQTMKYSFPVQYIGKNPGHKLCKASNGKFYGFTHYGGKHNLGVMFEYDPTTNIYAVKIDFDVTDSIRSSRALLQASNGKLYGIAHGSGNYKFGFIFEYVPSTNTFTRKCNFDTTYSGVGNTGSLIQASNGKLYGLSNRGGQNNNGVIFEYNIVTDSIIKKYDFGWTDGSYPNSSLIQASNGKLYGMTGGGGLYYHGVIFEYDLSTNTFTKKFDFDGNYSGKSPNGSLIQASNGKLYGMTSEGGQFNKGVIFEYDLSTNILIKKFDFDVTKGNRPLGSLMQAASGKLYGMTCWGGQYGKGVLFEYNIVTDTLIRIISFDGVSKGSCPEGTLIQISNRLYGLTQLGGLGGQRVGHGVLFEYNILEDSLIKKVDFNYGILGNFPTASLLDVSNGKLYGMTPAGGQYGGGVLFEYNPATNAFMKKVDFERTNKGSYPFGSLIQATNGKLYGMTSYGGQYDYGVIFEYDTLTNTYIKKIDFDGSNTGSHPMGSLMQASNGKLYGMTQYRGQYGHGVLFEYNPAMNTITKKIDFEQTNNGRSPLGSLIQASNGKLYGMTRYGGQYGEGVLFEYNTATNAFSKIIDFDGTNGRFPYGTLIQATNGKLYGMTSEGAQYFTGALFEYDPSTSIFTKKIDFDVTNTGGTPRGSLIQASNGNLFGTTYFGGQNNAGVIFEYNIFTDSLIKKFDFNHVNGAYPYGDLIEVKQNSIGFTTATKDNSIEVSIFPNPNNGSFTLSIDNSNTKTNETYLIEIYDVIGNLLHSEEIRGGSSVISTLQMESLGKGMYFLSLKTKDNILTSKFMVQ